MRDLSTQVKSFLLKSYHLHDAPNPDDMSRRGILYKYGDTIPLFDHWKQNAAGVNGHIYPDTEYARVNNISWQVQFWGLYHGGLNKEQVEDVLSNKGSSFQSNIHNISLAFWQYGIHGGLPQQNRDYGSGILKRYADVRRSSIVPVVWASLNPNCIEKLKIPGDTEQLKANRQGTRVDHLNHYAASTCYRRKLPYWDTAALLRTPTRCNASADGLHVEAYVDIMRTIILFNHLCDEDNNWIGSDSLFL
jgi:hypothetical protein